MARVIEKGGGGDGQVVRVLNRVCPGSRGFEPARPLTATSRDRCGFCNINKEYY